MGKSVHDTRQSFNAPKTTKVGGSKAGESLRAFLARIRETEKDICVNPVRRLYLSDLPASEWAAHVVTLWEENQ